MVNIMWVWASGNKLMLNFMFQPPRIYGTNQLKTILAMCTNMTMLILTLAVKIWISRWLLLWKLFLLVTGVLPRPKKTVFSEICKLKRKVIRRWGTSDTCPAVEKRTIGHLQRLYKSSVNEHVVMFSWSHTHTLSLSKYIYI